MHATWNGPRVAAAIARLKDTGMSESAIAKLAGASRATANRWARGAHRPDHDAVRRLAAAVYRTYPDVARELVEASGYPWADPAEAELPPPELDDDPETLEALRRAYRNDPGKVREAVEALRWAEAPPSGQPEGEGSSKGRRAG